MGRARPCELEGRAVGRAGPWEGPGRGKGRAVGRSGRSMWAERGEREGSGRAGPHKFHSVMAREWSHAEEGAEHAPYSSD